MDAQTITLIAAIVAAIGALVAAGATVVYTIFTRRLWTETKRQAITSQQMLEAANRPWLSIELLPDTGTGPGTVYVASKFRNHGNVPGTITKTTMRTASEGKAWGEGDPLVPTTGNPSNLCIFPGEQTELVWGTSDPTSAPWPRRGWLRFQLEITYRGAFEERTYHTRVEARYPVPEGTITSRSSTPMQVVNEDAT